MKLPIIEAAVDASRPIDSGILELNNQEVSCAIGYAALNHSLTGAYMPFRRMEVMQHFVDGEDGRDGRMYKESYGIAALSEVGQQLTSPLGKTNALKTLKVLQVAQQHSRPEIFQNTLSVLSDKPLIDELAKNSRYVEDEHPEEMAEALTSENSDHEVPKDFWEKPIFMAPSEELNNLLSEHPEYGKGVNLESIAIAALGHIIDLRESRWSGEKLLQQAFDAETVYAPLLEVEGFDGVAMALRNEGAMKRLYKAGHQGLVDRAMEHLAQYAYSQEYVKETVHSALSLLVDEHIDGDALLGDDPSHGIIIGESRVLHQSLHRKTPDELRAVWRAKTPGSLALKMRRYQVEHPEDHHDLEPSDTIGITLITKDFSQQMMLFSDIVRRAVRYDMDETSGFELKASASRREKNTPFHVRGREDDLNIAMPYILGMNGDAASRIEEKIDCSGFEVMKVTFLYRGTPIELQVMTEATRIESRIGAYSHAAHKGSSKGLIKPEDLLKIKRRSEQFDKPNPTNMSRARAAEYELELARIELSDTALEAFFAMQDTMLRV